MYLERQGGVIPIEVVPRARTVRLGVRVSWEVPSYRQTAGSPVTGGRIFSQASGPGRVELWGVAATCLLPMSFENRVPAFEFRRPARSPPCRFSGLRLDDARELEAVKEVVTARLRKGPYCALRECLQVPAHRPTGRHETEFGCTWQDLTGAGAFQWLFQLTPDSSPSRPWTDPGERRWHDNIPPSSLVRQSE